MKMNTRNGVYTYNNEEYSFNFYTFLDAYNRMLFVNNVTDLLVGNNYNSVIRDLVFDYNVISIFTNVDTSKVDDENNTTQDTLSSMEELVYETNIVEIVKKNAIAGVIDELNKAVDDNIEYRTGIHKNPIADSLSHLLNTIDNKVANINTDDMMKMAQVISKMSGELTADKMLEAYSKSDIFKEKYKELVINKKQDGNTTIKKTRSNKKGSSVKLEEV